VVITAALVFGPVLRQPDDVFRAFDPGHLQAVVYREDQNHCCAPGQRDEQRNGRDHTLAPEETGLAASFRALLLGHWPPRWLNI